MSYSINLDKVFEDSEGIYFSKIDSDHVVSKVRPSEIGFSKTMSTTIFIEKTTQSEDVLSDTVSVFSQELTISVKSEARFKYIYLYKTKSGIVHQKDFESGSCSAVNINPEGQDSLIEIKRGRAKKLPNDSFLLKSVPIYTIRDGVYERKLSID